MYAGTACQPISLRQLGSAVGIKNVEEVNRIIRKWLDDGIWLGLVEAGKPTPNSRKANVYKLIESGIVTDDITTPWRAFIAPLKCYKRRLKSAAVERRLKNVAPSKRARCTQTWNGGPAFGSAC
jgi:hypothetical protein